MDPLVKGVTLRLSKAGACNDRESMERNVTIAIEEGPSQDIMLTGGGMRKDEKN